jgi:phosphoribosylformylglycinamidine synthase PurS subunit
MHVTVRVTLRKSILDPQGKAVEHGIHTLGYPDAANVRIGKVIELDLGTNDRAVAIRQAEEIAGKLLANPVMEDYHIEAEERPA